MKERVVGAYVKQDFVLFCFNIQREAVHGGQVFLFGGVFYNRGDSHSGPPWVPIFLSLYRIYAGYKKAVRNGTALFFF